METVAARVAARKTARRSKAATRARSEDVIRARTARENMATGATRAATESGRVDQRGSEKVGARRETGANERRR